MEKIKLAVVEEHHEVYPVWYRAAAEGLINQEGNALLHVDQHADLDIPVLYSPMRKEGLDIEYVEDFTYNELSISNFIVPAIFAGIFDRMYWLNNEVLPESSGSDCSIFSIDGGRKILSLKKKTGGDHGESVDARRFLFRKISLYDTLDCGSRVVLDIDLDFFSCNKKPLPYNELEITRGEFLRFKDRHHFLKLDPSNKIKPVERDGGYYLVFNDLDYEINYGLKVSEETIIRRISLFNEFLSKNKIRPSLITIARSRFSNYTPEDQWEFIETRVIDLLHVLYDF
jgi:hypothetical protein